MRSLLALGALWLVCPALWAQDSTSAALNRARRLYEDLNVERALPLFRLVVSPQWRYPITDAQRAEAYKYIGAAFVLLGQPDSAQRAFQAAITRDPFTDLDAVEFAPAQRNAFDAARRRTFIVASRPAARQRADLRTERISFTVVTTHAAALRAVIRPSGGDAFPIFDGESEGVRQILWNGLTHGGQVAPPGRYELRVIGRSRLNARSDSTSVFFDVAHQAPALEDTLPDLDPATLLPEHVPGARPWGELGKGAGVAAGVWLLSQGLAHEALGSGQAIGALAVAAAGVASGVVAMITQERRGEIPENVAENRRREAERRRANEAIQARNRERRAAAVLIVTPAAGVVR